MVERIYGGRLPLFHDKSALFSSPRAQRFSSEKTPIAPGTNLGTICETTDEVGAHISPCGSASSLYYEEEFVEPGPPSYRKPRAMSLPAIYRDGSYVKLKNQIVNMRKTSLNKPRRFSAPSGPSTNILYTPMQRHVRRISAGSNTTLPLHRESIFKLIKRGKAGDEILDNRSSFTGKNYKTKELRRHSDPLLYSTIPLSPDNATETKEKVGKLSETSVEVQAATPAIHNNENTEKRTVINSYSRPRRKSSVVPVPFRIPESQKKKQPTGSKPRPLSFPPAKEHQGRIRSLQSSTVFISEALKETVSHRHPPLTLKYPSLVHNSWDMVQEKGKLDRLCLDDNTELEEEFSQNDFCSRAERIVQWMNFFG